MDINDSDDGGMCQACMTYALKSGRTVTRYSRWGHFHATKAAQRAVIYHGDIADFN